MRIDIHRIAAADGLAVNGFTSAPGHLLYRDIGVAHI